MAENWNSYFCNVNDKLASIRVDLAMRRTVPDAGRPWLLWVWVFMKQSRPDGLSSREEFETLSSLEDTLAAALERRCQAVLSGCITTDGRREFYFYGTTPEDFGEAVRQTMGSFTGYKFECDSQRDAGWTQYLTLLYPSEEQFESIKNREVLDVLRQKGDKLESARDILHWAYFKNQSDREIFRQAVDVLGFRIDSQSENPTDEYRFGICVSRREEMTQEAIDDAVIQLFRATKSALGQYDGWECELIVDPNPIGKSG